LGIRGIGRQIKLTQNPVPHTHTHTHKKLHNNNNRRKRRAKLWKNHSDADLKIHFPKTNSHSGFFVAIVVVVLLLLLLLCQQDETNVKIFLPVATATDKNTRLHCQLPSPFPCFAYLSSGFP
jgi:hypothetical protein